MKIHIKNMVSSRCIAQVQQTLLNMGIEFTDLQLGEVNIPRELSLIQELEFKRQLKEVGFELMADHKTILSEKIKLIIIEMVHYSDETIKVNFSVFLSDKLNHNYTYLSNVFRSVNGMTIQQFIIINKIEKIKELLLYGELNLSEISYKLNYSSIAHLSNQFKKVTGITPSFYKQQDGKVRIPIDGIGSELV
ncbi:MAG: AraC family transcriptional regulator [Crocinitomicaceae bacterium]|nr:AraC family transcriptional regulator [Crocinitomicaceae bacterium]MCF8409907.1 AraC family transcriptional regulator [Crocinitomicaceae bacterium]MCF8445232.1 AraC family transcriptional regulator [Crocinitomicaceae bacterium]